MYKDFSPSIGMVERRVLELKRGRTNVGRSKSGSTSEVIVKIQDILDAQDTLDVLEGHPLTGLVDP